VPVFQIPVQQLKILKVAKNLKTPVYIATNLLETMVTKPYTNQS
jgi:pyruvate kinase